MSWELYSVPVLLLGLLLLFLMMVAGTLRRVVATNEVHIVQSSGATTSYGSGTGNGNTCYAWPSWVPKLGTRGSSCRSRSST